MSLRERLNSMGIDGHRAERLIQLYYDFVRETPNLRMNAFLSEIKAA